MQPSKSADPNFSMPSRFPFAEETKSADQENNSIQDKVSNKAHQKFNQLDAEAEPKVLVYGQDRRLQKTLVRDPTLGECLKSFFCCCCSDQVEPKRKVPKAAVERERMESQARNPQQQVTDMPIVAANFISDRNPGRHPMPLNQVVLKFEPEALPFEAIDDGGPANV